jgi:hypothetical protein
MFMPRQLLKIVLTQHTTTTSQRGYLGAQRIGGVNKEKEYLPKILGAWKAKAMIFAMNAMKYCYTIQYYCQMTLLSDENSETNERNKPSHLPPKAS